MLRDIDALSAELEERAAGGTGQAGVQGPGARGAMGGGEARGEAGGAESWDTFFTRTYRQTEPGEESPRQRYARLLQRYRGSFPGRRVGMARAPGRVNLVGEHTDYNAGPVLPAAADRDIVAVWVPREDGRVIAEEADGRYGRREFCVSADIPPFPPGDWGNYLKAAVQELVRETAGGESREPLNSWRGFNVMVQGTVPPAGGLSSSSALVVLAGLIFLAANGMEREKKGLAESMAAAEYYVGTRGGGMDQAASLLGEAGKALLIDFADFSIRTVPLPPDTELLVAHSTVPAAKSAAARQGYNLRAAECRVAADIARRFAERRGGGRVKERSLGTLRHRLRGVSGAESEELAAEIFPREGYPLQILEREYGIGSRELAEDYYLDPELLEEGTLPVLKLRQRFLHVLDECERVERFADLCRRGQKEAAGEVMNASHRSCRDLFEISCPELDVLTEIEKRGGALGARMTGAGFGGCTVALAERGRTEELRRVIIKEYYQAYLGEQRESYGDLIFPISAARGAEIL